jgi:hypothetical protein
VNQVAQQGREVPEAEQQDKRPKGGDRPPETPT